MRIFKKIDWGGKKLTRLQLWVAWLGVIAAVFGIAAALIAILGGTNEPVIKECEQQKTITQKISCYLARHNVTFDWREASPEFKFRGDIEQDKHGNLFYELIFDEDEREDMEKYRLKLLVIFELNKKRNNISSAAWLSPKFRTLSIVPSKIDFAYLYLFVCFDAPDDFNWSKNWEPGNLGEGIFYPKGNYMDTFVNKVIKKLKKLPGKGVLIYAVKK